MIKTATIQRLTALSILILMLQAFTPLLPFLSSAMAQDFLSADDDEPPLAINQYDDRYKNPAYTCESLLKDKSGSEQVLQAQDNLSCSKTSSIIPNYIYKAYFIRTENNEDNDKITLRLLSPVSVTGCLNISKMSVETLSDGILLRLLLKEAELEIDKSVQYAHYECDTTEKASFIDLEFSRKELEENKTKEILIKTDKSGLLFKIKIDELNDNKIVIISTTPDLREYGINMAASTETLAYWFYPDDTLLIHTPGAPMNAPKDLKEQIDKALESFANTNGLTPLSDSLKDFAPPAHYTYAGFYQDPSKGFLSKLKFGIDDPIGTIEIFETFYGSEGEYKKPRTLDVFARIPGEYN